MEQLFNYNTYTFRSGSFDNFTDEEVLEKFIKTGFTKIGFSEKLTDTRFLFPNDDQIMLSEVDDYIYSINNLKEKYKNFTIYIGVEAEFNFLYEDYLRNIRKKVDYVILSQKRLEKDFKETNPNNNPNYPIEYAFNVIKALDTGLFDIVAYPDYFMKYRDSIEPNNIDEFYYNCEIAALVICEKARDMGVPVEINVSSNKRVMNDKELECSHSLFWKIAKDVPGLKVMIGYDFKDVSEIDKKELINNNLNKIVTLVEDKLISNDYDPVVSRKNNEALIKAYNNNKDKVLTYESLITNSLLKDYLKNNKDFKDIEFIKSLIDSNLGEYNKRITKTANDKDNSVLAEVASLSTNEKFSGMLKIAMLNRKKKIINGTNQVLANQEALLEKINGIVNKAFDLGCSSKEELINISTQLMEYDTTISNEQKDRIAQHIEDFKYFKSNKENGGITRKLVNPKYGFANITAITLLLTFITGFGVGIAYMLIQLGR